MKTRTLVLAAFLAGGSGASGQQFEPFDTEGWRWYKGNTHTHTTESDGDSPPEVVVQWYRSHGYNFLVLSDHNVFTDPARYRHLTDSTFLLVPGEELTSSFGSKPVHVNGLNLPGLVQPRRDSTLVGTVQANVDAIREASGVPHVNHPNFGWAITAEALLRLQRDRLIEIFNGHPLVHNEGGDDMPGMEAVWDHLLTRGKRVYGIAVDDAHHFQGEFAADRANPGRGWVAVAARSLEPQALMTSLEEGRFYASTGVELEGMRAAGRVLSIQVRPKSNFKYTTEFIGPAGRVLAVVGGVAPSYTLTEGVAYVRARVRDSGGAVAWTQPIFVRASDNSEARR